MADAPEHDFVSGRGRIYGAEPRLMEAIETVRAAGLDVHLTGTLAVGTPGARLIAISEQPAGHHESAEIEWTHLHKGSFRGRLLWISAGGAFCEIEVTNRGALPSWPGLHATGDSSVFFCSFLSPDPRQLP